jgi:Uma2 family endonuclease
MSWDDYCLLDESVSGEYLDGCFVMTPSPDRRHQQTCRRLANALEGVLPIGYEVNTAWEWMLAASPPESVIPDVMVYAATQDSTRYTGLPVLAVEVLSQNRDTDLVRKKAKYAAAGLMHYWVADRVREVLDAYALGEAGYQHVRCVGHDAEELDFGVAKLTIGMAELLR